MDIDIDIQKTADLKTLLPIVPASTIECEILKRHLVGYYFQNIPKDTSTGLSAIPYKEAEKFGFTKIDFLHLNLLDSFKSRSEIEHLLDQQTDWELLQNPDIVSNLFHLSKHFDTLSKVKPKSTEELADVLALIRPNKIRLLDKYLQDRKAVRPILYKKHDPSDLRKSHAIAYALNIRLQMKLLEKQYAIS